MSAAIAVALALAFAPALGAQEPIDWDMVNRIRGEGLGRSRVMETLSYLTDVIGPRLTGSPGLRRADEWARDRLSGWGLADARVESWGRFGRGWSFDRTAVHLLRPRATPLLALPKAWTPATAGPVRGLAQRVSLADEEDLEQQRGKLRGLILLLDDEHDAPQPERPEFRRYSAEELEQLTEYPTSGDRESADYRKKAIERYRFGKKLRAFLAEEGVLATVEVSSWGAGIIRVGGVGTREPGEETGPPGLVMAAEHYDWLVRLLERGEPSRARDRRRRTLPRRRPRRLQHDRRDPRHRPQERAGHGRRAPRLLARGGRRQRQRRGLRGGDGSGAHPPGARGAAAAHHSYRAVER